MTLTYKIFTNVGNREINEDSVGEIASAAGHCFVVADGLGGHGHASQFKGVAAKGCEIPGRPVLYRCRVNLKETCLSQANAKNPKA